MTQEGTPTFAGFDPAHTTPIPNELIDELLTVLSWDELKVFLYITRRTKGFGKEKGAISLAQFTDGITTKDGRVLDSGCGIKNRARVVDARDSLEERGYICFEQVVRGNGHGATVYSICYRGSDASVPSQSSGSDATVPTTSDGAVPTGSDASVPHKIKLTKDSRQEIVITDAIASTPAPLSQKKEPITEPQEKPAMPDVSMPWGTRKCLMIFDALRGTRLIGLSQIKKANADAKGLAEQYSEEQVMAVYRQMNNTPYWKERGGADLGNVAANIHKEIRKIRAFSTVQTPQPAVTRGTGLSEGEAGQLARNATEMARAKDHEITATPKPLESGAWAMVVDWQTEGLKPMTIKTREHWNIAFGEMCDIWKTERKRVAING